MDRSLEPRYMKTLPSDGVSIMSPTAPWSMVAKDLFTFSGKAYLITVDYYSDFWELDAVSDTSGETITECAKVHFAHYGIPEKSNHGQWTAV